MRKLTIDVTIVDGGHEVRATEEVPLGDDPVADVDSALHGFLVLMRRAVDEMTVQLRGEL